MPLRSEPMRFAALATALLTVSACASPAGSGSTTALPSTSVVPVASTSAEPTPTPVPTLTWQVVQVRAIPAAAAVPGLTAGTGPSPLYVAVGVSDMGLASASAGGNYHLGASWISTDGTGWQAGGAIPTARMVRNVAYGAGRFVAVGDWSGAPRASVATLAAYAGGEPPGIWWSTDGRAWTGQRLSPGLGIGLVAFGDAGFLAVGTDAKCSESCDPANNLQTPVFTSADGLRWSSHMFADGRITALAASSRLGYVAVGAVVNEACPEGSSAAAWFTADGMTWSRTMHQADCTWPGQVIATDSGYLAIGQTAASDTTPSQLVVWRSADGRSWSAAQLVDSPDGLSLTIGFAHGTCVLATDAGIWELTDGGTLVRSYAARVPYGVFGGGVFLGVSGDGAVVLVPKRVE